MQKKIIQGITFLIAMATSLISYSQIPGQVSPYKSTPTTPPPATTNTPMNSNIAPNTAVVGGGPYAPGAAVMVKWHGSWWPAHVLQVGPKGNRWFIHYDNYASSWDEWVGPGRIRPR